MYVRRHDNSVSRWRRWCHNGGWSWLRGKKTLRALESRSKGKILIKTIGARFKNNDNTSYDKNTTYNWCKYTALGSAVPGQITDERQVQVMNEWLVSAGAQNRTGSEYRAQRFTLAPTAPDTPPSLQAWPLGCSVQTQDRRTSNTAQNRAATHSRLRLCPTETEKITLTTSSSTNTDNTAKTLIK